jgi:peptidyl-prolyl cis-trans isomerase SurA
LYNEIITLNKLYNRLLIQLALYVIISIFARIEKVIFSMKINITYLWVFLLFVNLNIAQIKDDAVLFTVENTPVLVSEFLKVYNKNLNLIKDESQKDVDEYLKLFINYKLKLIEAKVLEFDRRPQYLREFENYKKQLAKNYLTDHKVTDELVEEAYQRLSYDVKASHVLVKLDAHDKDTIEAYSKIVKLRERLLNENFENLQKEVHDGSAVFAEDLGYFSGLKMDYDFENVAYNTKVGDVSEPFRTSFGYHSLKVFDKRESRGEVTVGHIMISNNQKDTLVNPEIRIKEIYRLLEQGENFESLAKQFSEDTGSAKNGGKLKPFKSTQLRSVEFEDMAFSLSEIGQTSKPFKTNYGWHIAKLYSKTPFASFEDMKFDLEAKVKKASRSKLINTAMHNTLKEKYNILEGSNEALAYFESIINEEFFNRSWTIPADLIKDKSFLKIEDKQYTYNDFATFLHTSQLKTISKQPAKDIVEELYNNFLDEKILAYHEENLEFDNSEYAEILKEYREGLLLFDLMEAKIWNAVKLDTLGLENFFNEHKENYKWEERIDAIVATSSKEEDINKVIEMLKSGKNQEAIKTQLNTNDAQNVIFTTAVMTAEYQSLPEYFEFKVGVSKVYFYNDAFHVIDVKNILPQTGKTFEEAKGRSISDYQDEVEKKWLQSLENTYKVEVNQDVLAKVKSLINNN